MVLTVIDYSITVFQKYTLIKSNGKNAAGLYLLLGC